MSEVQSRTIENKPTARWVKVTIVLMVLVFVGVVLGRDLIWAKYYVWKLRQAAAAKDAAGMRVAEGALTNYPNLFMVLGLYDDPDPQVRLAFVQMAVQMHKPLTGDLFTLLFTDSDPEVRRVMIRTTTQDPGNNGVGHFLTEIKRDQFSLADRQLMVEMLGRTSQVEAKEELKQLVLASSWPAEIKSAVSAPQSGKAAWGTDLPTELLAAVVMALGDAYRDTNNPAALAALGKLKETRGNETFTGWLPVEEEARAILVGQAPANPQVSALVPLATQAAPTRTLGALIDQAVARIRTDSPAAALPDAIRAATQESGGQ